MSRVFYNKMKGLADNLLTKYGHSITLTDAQGGVLDTYTGLKAPVRVENTPQTVLDRSQATVYITAANVAPKQNQYLEMDGDVWNIVWVEPVRPTDITILYTLFVSRGG